MIAGEPGLVAYTSGALMLNIVWNFSLPYQMACIAQIGGPRFVALIPAAQAAGATVGAGTAGWLIARSGFTPVYVLFLSAVLVALALFVTAERSTRRG